MWSSRFVVRQRTTCTLRAAHAPRPTAGHDFAWRSLSDSRGGGGGRGGGRKSGSSSGAFDRFIQSQQGKRKQRPPNFSEKFLDPAARGELTKKHTSGIPKLAARKSKSHAVHDSFPGRQAQEIMPQEGDGDEDVYEEERARFEAQQQQQARDINVVYTGAAASLPEGFEYDPSEDGHDDEGEEVKDPRIMEMLFPPTEDDLMYDKYMGEHEVLYDSEDEYEEEHFVQEEDTDEDADDEGLVASLAAGRAGQEEHEHGVEEEDNTPMVRDKSEQDSGQQKRVVDPAERVYFPDILDFDDPMPGPMPDEVVNRATPLQEEGPELSDFLEAMYSHPTKFAEVRRYNLHHESRREAKPDIPRNRQNSPIDFVTKYKRFLFVTGLSPNLSVGNDGDGQNEEADFSNPLTRSAICNVVAALLNVSPEQVCPANLTSAFVGLDKYAASSEIAQQFQETISSEIGMQDPILISKFEGNDIVKDDFAKDSPESILELKNLPRHMTVAKLAFKLLPADRSQELGGPLTVDQILMTSSTTALVRLESPAKVESALTSQALQERLEELGNYPIQFFRAKRERLHAGFTGPNRGSQVKRLGPRLIVSGDVPSDKFYRSHAGCILLRNLDETVTDKDISNFLKPYCANVRDVTGSVEWITSLNGVHTGRAFVGFDHLDEAEAFCKAVNGRIKKGLGHSPVVVKLIKDKWIPGAKPREARPARTEAELLESLNNWEQYVDLKEIEELENLGVNRMALDFAFRALRFHNSTYGPMDGALRSETLVPERDAGDEFRLTVREYIDTVKECMGTPENPGELYEGMHFPGEEIDLSIFDHEKKRQAQIKKRLHG